MSLRTLCILGSALAVIGWSLKLPGRATPAADSSQGDSARAAAADTGSSDSSRSITGKEDAMGDTGAVMSISEEGDQALDSSAILAPPGADSTQDSGKSAVADSAQSPSPSGVRLKIRTNAPTTRYRPGRAVAADTTSAVLKSPSKSAPVPDKPVRLGPIGKRIYYEDAFFFIARGGDTSNIAWSFAFQRQSRPGKDSSLLSGKFISFLSWKGMWRQLEPPGEYPVKVLAPQVIPPHSAFDFSWPTTQEPGRFFYHFDPYYLDLRFNNPLPVYRVINTREELGDLFIGNATLQGHSSQMEGVLLYYRLRIECPDTVFLDSTRVPGKKEGPVKLVFLNGYGGENFVFFIENPFDGTFTGRLAVKVRYNGEVLFTQDDIDYTVTQADTTWVPRIQRGWEFDIPPFRQKVEVKTRCMSERLDGYRFYEVEGSTQSDGLPQKVFGLLFDWRANSEADISMNKEKVDSTGTKKGSLKKVIRKDKSLRKWGQGL